MFRKKLTIMVLVSILLTGCLTGCGAQVAEAEQEREEAPLQTMEEDPDLSYEVPVSAPYSGEPAGIHNAEYEDRGFLRIAAAGPV